MIVVFPGPNPEPDTREGLRTSWTKRLVGYRYLPRYIDNSDGEMGRFNMTFQESLVFLYIGADWEMVSSASQTGMGAQ